MVCLNLTRLDWERQQQEACHVQQVAQSSRNNLLEKGPEHGDSNLNGGVVEDAEREVKCQKGHRINAMPFCMTQQQQQQLLQKDRQVSPSTGSPSTISPGTKRRISASAVGSASKVLQLMTERHGEMQNRTQEIRNTVAVAHNTMLDKVESLSKEFMEKHGELSLPRDGCRVCDPIWNVPGRAGSAFQDNGNVGVK